MSKNSNAKSKPLYSEVLSNYSGFTWIPKKVNLLGSGISTNFLVPNVELQQEGAEREHLNTIETENKDGFTFEDNYFEDTPGSPSFIYAQKDSVNGMKNTNEGDINLEKCHPEDMAQTKNIVHGRNNTNAKVSPEPHKKGGKICKFYNNPLNSCKYGNTCYYQHIEKKGNICWYFRQGVCWYKSNVCWNYHPKKIHRCREKKEKRENNETKRKKINLILEMKKIKAQVKKMNQTLSFILNKGHHETTDLSTVPGNGETKEEKDNESGEGRKIGGNVHQCFPIDEENETKLTEDIMVTKEFEQAINKIKYIKVQQTNSDKKEHECLKIGQRKGNPVQETNFENDVQEFPEIEQTTVDQKDAYDVYMDWITRGYWEKNAKYIDKRADDKDDDKTTRNNDAKIIKCSNVVKENGKNNKASEGPKMKKEQNF